MKYLVGKLGKFVGGMPAISITKDIPLDSCLKPDIYVYVFHESTVDIYTVSVFIRL